MTPPWSCAPAGWRLLVTVAVFIGLFVIRETPLTPLSGCAQPPDMSDRIAQLKQLGELLSAGVLTQAELEQQKALILNG